MNRLEVSSLAELKAALAGYLPGDPIVIQVQRKGALRYISLEMN